MEVTARKKRLPTEVGGRRPFVCGQLLSLGGHAAAGLGPGCLARRKINTAGVEYTVPILVLRVE